MNIAALDFLVDAGTGLITVGILVLTVIGRRANIDALQRLADCLSDLRGEREMEARGESAVVTDDDSL